MKARIALQNERYDIAAKAAKEIIDNGPYDLYDYEKLYHLEGDIENNPDNFEAAQSKSVIKLSMVCQLSRDWSIINVQI